MGERLQAPAQPTTGHAPVTVVGLGCAPEASCSAAAQAALAEAGLVVGGARHLAAAAEALAPRARQVPLAGDLAGLDVVADADTPAVVLASGDPGFFGVLRALRARLADPGRLRVLPAVSSVAGLFAHAGLSWDDAIVASAHGRDPTVAVNLARRFPKVAVLTSPDCGPDELATALGGLERRWLVGEQLGSAEAGFHDLPAGPADPAWPERWVEPNVVALVDPAAGGAPRAESWPARRTPQRWALPAAAFAHRDGMLTKPEVRASVLARLGPGPGDLVWDLGAGSGAVAVECARLGAAVVAVDHDPDACARTRANAARHGVPVEVVTARAPHGLDALPDPDAVFVGGGGADLPAVLTAAAARARRVVVATLVVLERLAPAQAALAEAGLAVDGALLQHAPLAPLGGGQRLAAENPVLVLEGRRDG